MGSEFTFYDYVDASGVNVIHDWLETIPLQAKAKLTKWLLHLEETPKGQWTRPIVDTLTDDCDGLFEVRAKHSGSHYRLLATHDIGDKTPTLFWGFQKNTKRVPPSECEQAFNIWAIVQADPQNRRVEHVYG